MLSKIILADDEVQWRVLVRDYLEQNDCFVLEASNGEEAVSLLRENPDTALVILDIMMPRVNGLEASRMIRAFSTVPILMVTAREDEETEVSGFRCGADQFISKPVRMRAFMERVRSLLRRSGQNREPMRFEDLELDPASDTVRIKGEEVSMTPKEFDILLYLVQTPNVIRSREQIINAVWNGEYSGDGRTVDTHVKRLRAKLAPCGDVIRTAHGRGYLFAWNTP